MTSAPETTPTVASVPDIIANNAAVNPVTGETSFIFFIVVIAAACTSAYAARKR